MSTLRDARREYVRLFNSPSPHKVTDAINVSTLGAHQNHYIVPVFGHTRVTEILDVLPDDKDPSMVVLALIREEGVYCQFMSTGAPFEDNDRAGEVEVIEGELGELTDDQTVDDVLRLLNDPSSTGLGRIRLDQLLEQEVRTGSSTWRPVRWKQS